MLVRWFQVSDTTAAEMCRARIMHWQACCIDRDKPSDSPCNPCLVSVSCPADPAQSAIDLLP